MRPLLFLLLAGCSAESASVPYTAHTPTVPTESSSATSTTTGTGTTSSTTTPPRDPESHCQDGDATLWFEPAHPVVGDLVTVSVQAPTGYPWIAFTVAQPTGLRAVGDTAISGSGPHTWAQDYEVLAEGRYDLQFTADSGATSICTGTVWAEADPEGTTTGGTTPTSGDLPPDNPFGIGLVGPGNPTQWDLTADLAGPGGHIKIILPGVVPGMAGAPQEWVDAVQGAYDRDLVPVVRMNPPWGQMQIRDWSDDASHRDYTSYARAWAEVVDDLPRRGDWPLWIEVHNEPNLCYEWTCDASEGWIDSATMAAEYASLLRDVRDELNALGDPRIKVINGGLAPGGVGACECGTNNYSGGETSDVFIDKMEAEVPGIFASLDGFATHSYPSSGQGWGFFEPYSASGPGLSWWQTEIVAAGVPNHPVLITETGWTTSAGAYGSRGDIAAWTVDAWANDWFGDPRIEAVMPFMLQDGAWDAFAWVDVNGAPYPVYTAVKNWRCGMAFPEAC